MHSKIFSNIGWTIVAALSAIPIFFWLFMIPLNSRFSNLAISFTSTGQILGLVGMAMLSLTFVLNSRIKFLEKFFWGINKAYNAHHWFGALSFSILLFHPIFLAFNRLTISTREAANFLLSTNDTILFGIFGLLILMFLLVLTFFVKLPYHIWKYTHMFLGVAFLFAGLHSITIASDISVNQPLRIYMLLLILLALISIIYRTILGIFLVKRFDYLTEEVTLLPGNVYEISLKPKDKKINFLPGQFVFINFQKNSPAGSETHPFSITSSPDQENLSLGIKELGDYTSQIKNIIKGTTAKIEGPFGKFSYLNFTNKNQAWIAGGIGVTPFISMAQNLNDPTYTIDLYYLLKNESEGSYLNKLKEISLQKPNIKLHIQYSEKDGYLTADRLKNDLSDFQSKDFYICGPQIVMDSLKLQLKSRGINKNNIHTEEFNYQL